MFKNEVQKKFKQNKVYGYKGSQKKRRCASEQVKTENIQRTNKYKHLGITINEEKNLNEHLEEKNKSVK